MKRRVGRFLSGPYATQPVEPGKPATREQEDIRHGTRVLIASFVVPTGQVGWHLGQTRPRTDLAAHLAPVVTQLPDRKRYDWVVEPLNTHWSLAVCRVVAQWGKGPFVAKDLRRGAPRHAFLSAPSPQHVFHCTPTHGSWLNQAELWCSVLARRLLQRGDCCAAPDFATRLVDSLEV